MKYKCILFDFDGTLAHSDDALFSTFNDTLSIHGHAPLSRDTFKQYVGKKMRYLYKDYSQGSEKYTDEMNDTHLRIQSKHFYKYKLFPKVIETLENLKVQGYTLGIVTTANKQKMDELSSTLGLAPFFSVCVTPDDVVNIKPHKEPFEKALSILGFMPSDTLMVGDSDADIEGARAARIDSVGVTYSTIGERMKDFQPTYIIGVFDELLQIVGNNGQ